MIIGYYIYYMNQRPQKPPRYQEINSIYFLTFCTFKRLPLLHLPEIPEFLIKELKFYERKIQKLIAYTIMPDHVHLLVEVETVESLSTFLRDFKKFTSREINLRSSRSPNGSNKTQRVWQPGTMDHCIRMSWDNKDYSNHLAYLFYNSQKHLNITPKDFPLSQFHGFCQRRVFRRRFLLMG